MPTIASTSVRFSDARHGIAPATHGQCAMYGFVENMGVDSYRINIKQTVTVPSGSTVDDVLDAVRRLLLRHESLRTRLYRDSGPALWQELTAAGELTVELWNVVDGNLRPARRQIDQLLAQTVFDLCAGWPMRVAVVCADDVPAVVTMVLSHVAVDLQSAQIVA